MNLLLHSLCALCYHDRISTGNPRYRVSRELALRHALSAVEPTSPVAQYLGRMYSNSRIDYRYFSVPDLGYVADGEESSSDTNGRHSVDGVNNSGQSTDPPQAFYPRDGRSVPWTGLSTRRNVPQSGVTRVAP